MTEAEKQAEDSTNMTDEKEFLGVAKSATDRRWQGLDNAQMRRAGQISQLAGVPELTARILARLGVEPAEALAYLNPALRDLTPDPSHLLDMDKAVARIQAAVQNKERIAIFADYDVDGACSAALFIVWLEALGLTATAYIPDRLTEGYGPNKPAMQKLAAAHDLIICVDCGTMAHDALGDLPCDVLVLDHHQGGETLPPVLAVVNPNRQDETSELTYLCAAGVVFMTLIALNRLRKNESLPCPDLIQMLDLVALATVADVVPLVSLNRAFVRQGLKIMAQRKRIGLVALMDVMNLHSQPSTSDLGFGLAPCLNAGGRIGQSDLALKLLCEKDVEAARAMAEKLALLNMERREIESVISEHARAQVAARGDTTDSKASIPLIWAAEENWHSGVLGIVASRLKEAFNRPAIVIGFEDGIGRGSGRSLAGIDLGTAVATCVREGLLMSGGGHAMAAGLSVKQEKFESAIARLSELLARQGADKIGPPTLYLDGLARASAISPELIDALEEAGPFGSGVAGPRFALARMRVAYCKAVGEEGTHLQLRFQDETRATISAILFRAFDGPMGDILMQHGGRMFHIAGRLTVDTWRGNKSVKLRLEDIALVE